MLSHTIDFFQFMVYHIAAELARILLHHKGGGSHRRRWLLFGSYQRIGRKGQRHRPAGSHLQAAFILLWRKLKRAWPVFGSGFFLFRWNKVERGGASLAIFLFHLVPLRGCFLTFQMLITCYTVPSDPLFWVSCSTPQKSVNPYK